MPAGMQSPTTIFYVCEPFAMGQRVIYLGGCSLGPHGTGLDRTGKYMGGWSLKDRTGKAVGVIEH